MFQLHAKENFNNIRCSNHETMYNPLIQLFVIELTSPNVFIMTHTHDTGRNITKIVITTSAIKPKRFHPLRPTAVFNTRTYAVARSTWLSKL